WYGNVQFGFYRMIPGAFDLGVDSDQSTDRRDRRLGFTVVFVTVALIVSVYALAYHDRDLAVIGSMHADRTMSVDHLEAGVRRESLLQVIVVVECFPKNVGEVAVIDVDLIAQAGPVHSFH